MPLPSQKTYFYRIFLIFFAFALCSEALAQQRYPARNVVWDAKLQKQVSFLSDPLCGGRESGTKGAVEAAVWIERRFKEAGLYPMLRADSLSTRESYSQSFRTESGTVGHNIVGFMNGSRKIHGDEYIIVGAHYDALGTLGGVHYPSADANASGVVAAVSLAEMFSLSKVIGRAYFKSIIFVAFDGTLKNRAGSRALMDEIENGRLIDPVSGKAIKKEMVKLMVNLDQIGATLSPLSSGREDYLLAVDGGTLPSRESALLDWCNSIFGTSLELCHSYYGSENFTSVFFRITDQNAFASAGIPSVLFTSGITLNNNKPRDDAPSLNYPVFRRRIYLIWHWLENMMY